ncbi:MAG: DNA polymerase III subunit beta [Helicobacteraceae bacterium]|nr:DNA polymerase III subunit beta [Helicobacteraceae bacterium]
MNITIQKNVLDNILTSLQPFLDKKDASNITSHIYLEVKDQKLTCKATDFEMGLYTISDSLLITEEGIATVNGKQILDVIKSLKEGEINLYAENEHLNIKQNKSYFKLPMFDASEFPKFPDYENFEKLEISSLDIINSMKKIFPVVDTNNHKRELNGALLDIKEYSYSFVASDTKRLSVIKFEKPSGKSLSLIFPKKSILEIQKLFYDNVELFYSEKDIAIRSQNYVFFSHLINGKFPDYEKIMPKEAKIELNLPKSSIIDGIRLVNAVTNDAKLTFKKNEICFESLHKDFEAKTQIEIELNLEEEIEVGINSRHVLDFLGQIETANFNWILNGKNAPFILKSENFSSVIMPIVI